MKTPCFLILVFIFVNSVKLENPIKDVQERISYYTDFQINKLTITGSATEDAILNLIHSQFSGYSFQLLAQDGTFLINNIRFNIIEIKQGVFTINSQTVKFKSLRQSNSIKYISRYEGNIIIGNQPQWKQIIKEDFQEAKPWGWSQNEVSSCGGIQMLGGYGKFAGGEVTKTYQDIPIHNRLRIIIAFHFIDAWSGNFIIKKLKGESAFMRVNNGKNQEMQYVWTEKYDFGKNQDGINICGSSYLEGQFNSPIDIILPHETNYITIGLGSTLDQDPFENSWGISSIQMLIQ